MVNVGDGGASSWGDRFCRLDRRAKNGADGMKQAEMRQVARLCKTASDGRALRWRGGRFPTVKGVDSVSAGKAGSASSG